MTKKLAYHSTFNEVGWSLRETFDAIEVHGETFVTSTIQKRKFGTI